MPVVDDPGPVEAVPVVDSAPSVLAALTLRLTAPMALVTLGFSSASFHEPFHADGYTLIGH